MGGKSSTVFPVNKLPPSGAPKLTSGIPGGLKYCKSLSILSIRLGGRMGVRLTGEVTDGM